LPDARLLPVGKNFKAEWERILVLARCFVCPAHG